MKCSLAVPNLCIHKIWKNVNWLRHYLGAAGWQIKGLLVFQLWRSTGGTRQERGQRGDYYYYQSLRAQTVRGGTTKCLETLAFPRVGGWVGWGVRGVVGAGSSQLATDRLVGTEGGRQAGAMSFSSSTLWNVVALISKTIHQHDRRWQNLVFDTLLGFCQEMSRGCQRESCQTGGGRVCQHLSHNDTQCVN